MDKLKLMLLFTASMLVGMPVQAKNITMICKNPSEDYTVTFDQGARSVTETGWDRATSQYVTEKYTVLSIESSEGQLLVTGLTVNNGPTFRAQFRPRKKMEYFENSKLFETDPCR